MSFDSKRGPPAIEGMTSLKVDNLTYRTTIGDLERVFSKYGDLGDVYIPRDRYKQESRGFAFVRFYERRDAEDAMDALHGKIIDGREIRVQMAKYGRPTDPYKPRNSNRQYRNSYSYSSRNRSRSRSPRRRWVFVRCGNLVSWQMACVKRFLFSDSYLMSLLETYSV